MHPFQSNNSIFVSGFWGMTAVTALFAAASLFGVIGVGLANRAMVLIFAVVNWIVVIATILIYAAVWIYIMITKNGITDACTVALNGTVGGGPNSTPSGGNSPIYTPLFGSSSTAVDSVDACNATVRWVSIVLGVCVLVGGFFGIYFASAVGSYAARLKRFNNHTKLQDMDEMSYVPRKSLAGSYNTPY